MAAGGIRFVFTSMVPSFTSFGPVGIIMVAMTGLGLAALLVGFFRRWLPDAGEGTVVATMLPHAAASMIAWVILFSAW